MTRQRISSGSRFEDEIGYSRAVADGDWVFVSGTTGYDYAAMTIADDVVAQCDQALRNIAGALAKADAGIDDVVEAWFIVPDPADWPPCWPVLKKWFGTARPTSTLFHAPLYTREMKIEIKVTARRRAGVAPPAGLTIDRLDHLVLTCSDPEASAAWYERVLGMTRKTFGSDRKQLALMFGEQKINLQRAGHESTRHARIAVPGAADFCLITQAAPEAILAHLAACAVSVEIGPEARTGALGPMTSIYVRDPDGNLVEISRYVTPATGDSPIAGGRENP